MKIACTCKKAQDNILGWDWSIMKYCPYCGAELPEKI